MRWGWGLARKKRDNPLIFNKKIDRRRAAWRQRLQEEGVQADSAPLIPRGERIFSGCDQARRDQRFNALNLLKFFVQVVARSHTGNPDFSIALRRLPLDIDRGAWRPRPKKGVMKILSKKIGEVKFCWNAPFPRSSHQFSDLSPRLGQPVCSRST